VRPPTPEALSAMYADRGIASKFQIRSRSRGRGSAQLQQFSRLPEDKWPRSSLWGSTVGAHVTVTVFLAIYITDCIYLVLVFVRQTTFHAYPMQLAVWKSSWVKNVYDLRGDLGASIGGYEWTGGWRCADRRRRACAGRCRGGQRRCDDREKEQDVGLSEGHCSSPFVNRGQAVRLAEADFGSCRLDHLLLCRGLGVQEGLHRRLAKAPAALIEFEVP
jgi:hypothetical protein